MNKQPQVKEAFNLFVVCFYKGNQRCWRWFKQKEQANGFLRNLSARDRINPKGS